MEVFQPTPILRSNAPTWAADEPEDEVSPSHKHYNSRQVAFLPSQPYNELYQGSSRDDVQIHDWSQGRDGYHDPSKTGLYTDLPFLDRSFCAPAIVGMNNSISWSYVPSKEERRKPLSQDLIDVQMRRASDARRERQVHKIARQLAALFMRCEGYAKYRSRQSKTGSEKDETQKDEKHKDQVWPDDMEDAFLRALVRWPPVARKQYRPRPDAKQMGRNECIADYILQATGGMRDRKQVSSHIQVLKPFVQGVPEIMQFLSSEKEDQPQRHAARRAGRQASMYRKESHSWTDEAQRSQQQHEHRHQPSLCKVLDLQIQDFEMYMRKTSATDSAGEQTFHTYTTYRPEDDVEKKSVYIRDRSDLVRWYPELGHLPSHRLHSGRFVGVESSLSVHDQGLTISNPRGIELAIAFAFVGAAVTPIPRIKCRTKIFRNGQIEELVDPVTKLVKAAEYDDMEVEQVSDKTGKTTALRYGVTNFRSPFWARLFWELASDQQSANLLANSLPNLNVGETLESRQTKISTIRNSVADTIRGVTAVQEFEASMHADGRDAQIVLTIHWSFHQARDGEAGVTMWRDIDMSMLQAEDWSSTGAVKRASLQSGITEMSESEYEIKPEESFDASTAGSVEQHQHSTGFETFDFGQPLQPYYGYSAQAAAGGLPDLSTLQSPISFAIPNGTASHQELYSGVPSNVWHVHPAVVPSSVNAGASPFAHDHDQHQHQHQPHPYSQNDLDFSGNCHINMSYTTGSQQPSAASTTTANSFNQSACASTIYDSQGLMSEIDLGSSTGLEHHATDPLLLGSYDDHGVDDGSTPWDTVRPFSEAFFETGHTLSADHGNNETGTQAFHDVPGGQDFPASSTAAAAGSFTVPSAPGVLGLPTSDFVAGMAGQERYEWLQQGLHGAEQQDDSGIVLAEHQDRDARILRHRSFDVSFQPTSSDGHGEEIEVFETVDYGRGSRVMQQSESLQDGENGDVGPRTSRGCHAFEGGSVDGRGEGIELKERDGIGGQGEGDPFPESETYGGGGDGSERGEDEQGSREGRGRSEGLAVEKRDGEMDESWD